MTPSSLNPFLAKSPASVQSVAVYALISRSSLLSFLYSSLPVPASVQSGAVCALISCSSPLAFSTVACQCQPLCNLLLSAHWSPVAAHLAFCTGLPVPASVQKPKWAALKIVLPNSQFQYGSNADTSSRLLVVCISPPLWSSWGRNGILESLSLPVCPSIQLTGTPACDTDKVLSKRWNIS